MGAWINTVVWAFDVNISRLTGFEIHELVYADFKLEEQDIIMIQIDRIRSQVFF
jgi:hypothetical protein